MDIAEMQNQVFARRPVLKEILSEYGSASLKVYVQEKWQLPKAPDAHFLALLEQEISKIYGPALASASVRQLLAKPLVSSIDHLGIWNHPTFVNSSLIYSLHFRPEELAIVLATESVSLNNTSSWSGCLFQHQEGKIKRYSFFPDRQKTLPVFSAPAVNRQAINKFLSKAPHFKKMLEEINLQGAEGAENFSTQACQLSHQLWQKVFPSAPKLVYFPLESLVAAYLLKACKNPKELFSQIILETKGQSLWQKYFKDEHTFLFWGLNGKGRRTALATLPPAGQILQQLELRKIYPSSPLCFAVLLKAGLACVGGFTQTTWLTQVKQKFSSLLKELSGEALPGVSTKNFAESSLAWLGLGSEYVAPTAADLYFTGKNFYPVYQELAGRLSLRQSFELALPTIYSVVVPGRQRAGFGPEKYQAEMAAKYLTEGGEELRP